MRLENHYMTGKQSLRKFRRDRYEDEQELRRENADGKQEKFSERAERAEMRKSLKRHP